MSALLSSSTELSGATPWATGSFQLSTKALTLRAFGLGADDKICVKFVRKVQIGESGVVAGECGVTLPSDPVIQAREYLTDCGVKICICQKQPWVRLDPTHFPAGDYELEVSGTNVAARLVTVDVVESEAGGSTSCAACAVCEPVVAVPPSIPVTATVSICPVPACFTWGGTQYTNISEFVDDVKSLVYGAAYNPVTCTFSAPQGSVFPSLTIAACVPVAPTPVYCPSFRLDVCDCNEIGFAYRAGDSIDPAATVQILDCEGIAVGFGYPTPRVGATVPYTENNVVIGYLQNQSACAPEASTTVNVYNTNNVAAPTVNNAFAPVTNVAAPTVVLPAPTVASQTLNANDAIVTTLTDGTVFTTPLSNC